MKQVLVLLRCGIEEEGIQNRIDVEEVEANDAPVVPEFVAPLNIRLGQEEDPEKEVTREGAENEDQDQQEDKSCMTQSLLPRPFHRRAVTKLVQVAGNLEQPPADRTVVVGNDGQWDLVRDGAAHDDQGFGLQVLVSVQHAGPLVVHLFKRHVLK